MDVTSSGIGTSGMGSTEAAAVKAKTTLNSDFETFLKMLTAQMQNQDPLNPVDSTEFASQLAAFSTVEQQVRTNDLLTDLGTQLGILGMGQLQGWVGMTARAVMPVAFEGTAISLTLTTQPQADLARLVVRDAAGGVVQEQTVPAQGGDFIWTGRDDTGHILPNGTYSLSVDSFLQDQLLGSTPVESQARIVEARLSEGSTVLVMEGGSLIPASKVLGLRKPDPV